MQHRSGAGLADAFTRGSIVSDLGQQSFFEMSVASGASAGVVASLREAERPDVVFERSPRAHRYRLTLRRDGTAVAIIPLRGSEREARVFVEEHREWLERAREIGRAHV